MANFTGKTWHRNIAPASKYPVIFADRNTHVAQVISRGLPADEVEANCNLIAAAREMYAALETIAKIEDPRSGDRGPTKHARHIAKCALAKAEGR